MRHKRDVKKSYIEKKLQGLPDPICISFWRRKITYVDETANASILV